MLYLKKKKKSKKAVSIYAVPNTRIQTCKQSVLQTKCVEKFILSPGGLEHDTVVIITSAIQKAVTSELITLGFLCNKGRKLSTSWTLFL